MPPPRVPASAESIGDVFSLRSFNPIDENMEMFHPSIIWPFCKFQATWTFLATYPRNSRPETGLVKSIGHATS